MKKKNISIEEIKSFADAYQAGKEESSDLAKAIIEEVMKDSKKFAEKAGQVPEIVPFLLDLNLISKDQIMDYYVKISWLEHRDIILQLKEYESGKRQSKKVDDSLADIKIDNTGKSDAQIKAEWKTERLEDGTLCLLSYKGADEVIEIPEKIGKYPVSEIGPFAFSPEQPYLKSAMKPGRKRIRKITTNSSIQSLGESCFRGCTGLTELELSEGLKKIGENAFVDCTNLSSITIPEGVTEIGRNAFSGCSNLTSVTIPESVTSIGWSAFYGCTSLSSITIPEGVTEIGWCAFQRCSSLSSVTIPKSVRSIGNSAFYGCRNLTIHAPAGSFAQTYAENNHIKFTDDIK